MDLGVLRATPTAPSARLAESTPAAPAARPGIAAAYLPLAGRGIWPPFFLQLPFVQNGLWYEDHAVTFAVIGDYGVCAIGGCAEETRVAEMVMSWAPDFIVTTGDNNYPHGGSDTWYQNTAPYRQFIPDRFEPSIGNHDYVCGECPAQPFRAYFRRELTRTFAKPSERNPLLRFFVFDSNEADRDGETGVSEKAARHNPLRPQRAWLEQGLKTMPACWKLVVMHHPPYSSTKDPGSNTLLQSQSGWTYRQWGADLVFSGHAHNYERIMRPGSTFAYIVDGAGGGGRDPLPAVGINGSTVRVADAFGAVRVRADTHEMVLEFFTVDMKAPSAAPRLRDTYRIRRECNAVAEGNSR